jgi:effector-binding domain-containing protein
MRRRHPGEEPQERVTYTVIEETLVPQHAAAVRLTVPIAEISRHMGRIFGEVAAWLGHSGVPIVGPPFARYYSVAPEAVDLEAGFPAAAPVEPHGDVHASELPGGPAVTTMHIGPYEAMEPAYEAIAAWIREHGREAGGAPWEVYLTDPSEVPSPADWRTKIVQPLRT